MSRNALQFALYWLTSQNSVGLLILSHYCSFSLFLCLFLNIISFPPDLVPAARVSRIRGQHAGGTRPPIPRPSPLHHMPCLSTTPHTFTAVCGGGPLRIFVSPKTRKSSAPAWFLTFYGGIKAVNQPTRSTAFSGFSEFAPKGNQCIKSNGYDLRWKRA